MRSSSISLRKISYLLSWLVGLFVLTSGCDYFPIPGDGSATLPISYYEFFENGLGNWSKGSDLPDDPNRPGRKVDWHIETSALQKQDGTYSAEFYLDGTQDDGTIWLSRSFKVPMGKPVSAHIYLSLWSESESFNKLAEIVAYAGAKPASLESDFSDRRLTNETKGWKAHHYQINVLQHNGLIWVAFGVSALFETQLKYYIDTVKIQIE
jgi:hypothetical protein